MEYHAHVYALSGPKARLPILAEVNVSLQCRILNDEIAAVDHFRSTPYFLKIDLENGREGLQIQSLRHTRGWGHNGIFTSADLMNSR